MTEKDLRYVISVLKGQKPQDEPDYYSVLGFLHWHRVAGMFYAKSATSGAVLPHKVKKTLSETFERQKRKTEFMRAQISGVAQKLMHGRIEHAFLKGSVLCNAPIGGKAIYADGERVSNDADLLVKPSGISTVCEALRELGFTQGRYDPKGNGIIPFTRTELLERRMTRGEVAPFVRLTDNAEFPFMEIDINFSLGNTPEDGRELLEYIVDSAREYAGKINLIAPSPELFLLHLVMHQYKESALYFPVERGKDLDLYKLADIYYILREGVCDIAKAKAISERFGVADRLGAVAAQAGEAFYDKSVLGMAEELGGGQPAVTDYANKKRYVWKATVRERLMLADTVNRLKEV